MLFIIDFYSIFYDKKKNLNKIDSLFCCDYITFFNEIIKINIYINNSNEKINNKYELYVL